MQYHLVLCQLECLLENWEPKYIAAHCIQHTEAEWRLYASVNYATVGLDNDKALNRRSKPMLAYCLLSS